ncbi:twin-arginine translocase subunit TatC [Kitasatospora paracochleata]|uniref:Sec-independent protein translocase protein TatC n=1 Tax=Kitasatospora paracochleata TaxID=58354 RepID=A0ABT1IUA8_9ACTN|nr:twin-arginine translocase subunit TatC [Kitasatospora paracochleata]MCP2308723.1 sec-independent protein translocase protein TatC [Kitasatospora paracochleata]
MSKSSKEPKDPEGRMALADHLRELRNRLVKSLLAIILFTVVAAYFSRHLIDFLTAPLPRCADGVTMPKGQHCVKVANIGLLAPFTVVLKVSLTAGLVAATPVWLYQLWRFVAPGLHKHERRYSIAFLGFGTPLFLAGAAFAYLIMPTTAAVLAGMAGDNVEAIVPVETYLDLVTRMVVVFGLGFELPLFLVMLNFVGVLTGKRLLGWWRGMVMGITVFAAFATPSADPLSMLALAAPIWALYFIAVGVSLLNDKRRARRDPDAGLDDEEASHLDLSVDAVEDAEAVAASATPEASAPVPASRREQIEDIT